MQVWTTVIGASITTSRFSITSMQVVGEVFAVGTGDCGQLGLGPDTFEKTRPSRIDWLTDKQITNVFVGGMHNIALSGVTGRLYSWGCNDQLALGRPTGTGPNDDEESEPGPVSGLDDEFIIQVACGDSVTAALTKDGRYGKSLVANSALTIENRGTFRNNQGIFGMKGAEKTWLSVPTPVKGLSNVISIASGSNHLVAVTQQGKIYTWGVGEQGQLGRKIVGRYASDSCLTPRAINFRPRKSSAKFIKAFCGSYHTFVLHESNALYAFGLNNYGQLGIGQDAAEMLDEQCTHHPELVELPDEDEVVIAAAGGEHHSLILTESGKVYAFGRGDSSQTGFTDCKPRFTPEALTLPAPAQQIDCGSAFSMAITRDPLDKGNNLVMWGFGEQGQLANSSEDIPEPETIELKGRVVITAGGGGQHTTMLLKPRAK
ncbi:MAG: hypothetical protein SGCHY_001086 [Lobulomycetales sp.]